jgi:Asp-tRNA(Asn)/Glu-tRNA(Gln) amidotransferase A subunit family amidase
MELEELKNSKRIMTGSAAVESMRQILNEAFSAAPPAPEIAELFRAALDQIADQQVKVAEAFLRFVEKGNLSEAESAIEAAVNGAQSAALRAARGYADHESDEAERVFDDLTHTPVETGELVKKKGLLDENFRVACGLHEKNKITGLEPLLSVASEFRTWSSSARFKITGARGIIEEKVKTAHRQWFGIAMAILLGLLGIALGLFNILRK